MTLIIGIRCDQGVVLGADGATTIGGLTEPTRKLKSIDDEMIMGVAGVVSLAQLYHDRVSHLWRSELREASSQQSVENVQRWIRNVIYADAKRAIETSKEIRDLIGERAASGKVSTNSLIALPVRSKPELLTCDFTGESYAATEDLPYSAIGSGAWVANPFLSFLREVFWNGGYPSISQGLLSIVWTLIHAIRVGIPGVSSPIQVLGLVLSDDKWVVREMTEEQIQSFGSHVNNIESYLASYPRLG